MPEDDLSGVHVWLVFMKAHQALEHLAEQSISFSQLCFSDFKVLEILLHKGPLPVNSIGNKALLTSGALTIAVDRLEKKGWIAGTWKLAKDRNREFKYYRLTAEGKRRLAVEQSKWKRLAAAIASVMWPEEA